MKSPLVSIIVPVYNVAPFLKRCIDSIIAQTYTYYEVWLVDDGSTDESAGICDSYCCQDERVKVLHKKNGGLSSARNAALDKCNGDYILFVDSDDAISPNGLELLIETAVHEVSDVVISNRFIRFKTTCELLPSTLGRINNYYNLDGLQEVLCHNTRWEAWGSLFKKDLFELLRFPEGRLYEDLATTPIALYHASKITMIESPIYYYFQREGSIMHQKEVIVSFDLCTISRGLISFFKNSVMDNRALANICSGILMELCSRTDLAANHINNNREFVKESRSILVKNVKYVIKSDYYSAKRKVYYMMEALGFHRMIYFFYKMLKNK